MKTARFAAALLVIGGVFCAAEAAARADDFNEERLQSGRLAYQQKKYIEAIDQFRVAAFGSLDRPVVLSECLVRLSLAQAAAGRVADADASLNRFLEVERRFAAYAKASLEPETRSDFRALLTRRIPGAVISEAPRSGATPKASEPTRTQAPSPKSSS